MIGYNLKIHGKLLKITDYRYSINKKGEIFSLYTPFSLRKFPKKMSLSKTKNGYLSITLINDKRDKKSYLVHRLVAYAYLNLNIKNVKTLVNHKDLNKSNNSLKNLSLMNHSKNTKHWINSKIRISGLKKAKELGFIK